MHPIPKAETDIKTPPLNSEQWLQIHLKERRRRQSKMVTRSKLLSVGRANGGAILFPKQTQVQNSKIVTLRFTVSDVINRLNLLRGKGMASMYSRSSKRYHFKILTSDHVRESRRV